MGVRDFPRAVSGGAGVGHEFREREVGGLRRENDQLLLKLAQVGRAARGLAVELADARRELRLRQRRIVQLEAENERLGGIAHAMRITGVGDGAHTEQPVSQYMN